MAGAGTADVIIVLGAAPAPDGSPGPVIERRVAHAAGLFHAGRAPKVLMSGGVTQGAVPEAEIMAQVAVDAGVPAEAIHRETQSTRTFENAVECRKVMRAETWRSAVLVTDNFHMRRALLCFGGLRLDVTPDPVRVPFSPYVAAAYVREFFARQMYVRMIRAYTVGNSRG